jgi:myo-inositol 2-dehydrogenase/D-chiro-inositol 1-dehydrogenase
MQHFVECVLSDREPLETGDDGRAVLEIIYAMYLAAGDRGRARLPLEMVEQAAAEPPINCWQRPQSEP